MDPASADADARHSVKDRGRVTHEPPHPVDPHVGPLSFLIFRPSSVARADGGVVRLRQRAGGYQIAVFTSPTPIRAGPVDVSVLVQDAATEECVPERT